MEKEWFKKNCWKIFFSHLFVAELWQYDVFKTEFWKASFCCNLMTIWSFLGLYNDFPIVGYVIELMEKEWVKKNDGKTFFSYMYVAELHI